MTLSSVKQQGLAKLDNLQILRAVAAFSVVVAHCIHETANLAASTGRQPIDAGILNLGYGVDVFFVLSGFIMMHTSASEFGKSGASLRFFLRRCARVVPLYWLLTTVLLLGAVFAPSLLSVPIGSVSHVLASYLFVPDSRGVSEVRPVLALGWTLNYEMLFYVFFALALVMPLRLGVFWLTALMVSLALIGTVVDPAHVQISFWTSPLILEFLFGVFAALLFRRGVRIGLVPALALAGFGLLGFMRLSSLWDDGALPQFLRYGLPAASLVLAAAIGPAIPLTRTALWMVALGDASYSLYLSHPFVVKPVRAVWAKVVGASLPSGMLVLCSAALCVLLAMALYRFVERPLTSQVQQMLGTSRRKAADAQRMEVRP